MSFYVYIISNKARTLYTGLTNDLPKRLEQHKHRTFENAFTARYTFDRLVYFETAPDYATAARRERAIKGLLRSKKIALIEASNPQWKDLSMSWFDALMLD